MRYRRILMILYHVSRNITEVQGFKSGLPRYVNSIEMTE